MLNILRLRLNLLNFKNNVVLFNSVIKYCNTFILKIKKNPINNVYNLIINKGNVLTTQKKVSDVFC